MREVKFDIFPPGLRGLNRLASRLNALMANQQISDWHLGRWSDHNQTTHGIRFDNDDDAALANSSKARAVEDLRN